MFIAAQKNFPVLEILTAKILKNRQLERSEIWYDMGW
jgi:hypothetical protein